MRLLHLVDVHAGSSGPILHQMVRSCIGSMTEHDHVVIEVGGGARQTVLWSESAGRMPALAAIRPLTGNTHPIMDVLDEHAAHGAPIDLIQSWGPDSTRLSTACGGGWPRVAMLDAFSLTPTFSRELCIASDMVLCCTALGAAKRLIVSGVSAARVHHQPAVIDWPRSGERDAIREAWGADAETTVLGVFDEPRGSAGLRQVAHVVSRLGLLELDLRLIASPEIARLADTARWLDVLGFPDVVVADEAMDRPWTVIDALDVAVIGGGRGVEIAGGAGLYLARSRGCPMLLGSGHPATDEECDCGDVFIECDRHEDKATAWVEAGQQPVGTVSDLPRLVDGLRAIYEVFDVAVTPASRSQHPGAVS